MIYAILVNTQTHTELLAVYAVCHGRVTWESSVTAGGVTTRTVEVDRSPAAAEMTFERDL